MAGVAPTLETEFHPFGGQDLSSLLRLDPPHFSSSDEASRQLRYVERYAGELGCKALAVENHYIDRDYIEDHSVFYAKSLYPYANYCRRVHFFRQPADAVREGIGRAVQAGIDNGRDAYRAACERLSKEAYLGFSVIKPLDGSPVGRTVLRTFPEDPEKDFRRSFPCTRRYVAHLLGVEFQVRGLAFQQQDVGVSACATPAIWSVLQKASDHEPVAAATPAQITTLAARYSLPFGRAMPSEGLSLDQMCQAIQAIGLSPNLLRVDDDFEMARGYLFSAIQSGIAAVLILRQGRCCHAVAVAGMKVARKRAIVGNLDDVAADLLGVYVHDDRRGPYLSATLATKEAGARTKPEIVIEHRSSVAHGPQPTKENWELTHLLIPMHSKIRLSFSGLRHVAFHAAGRVRSYVDVVEQRVPGTIKDPTVLFDTSIRRSHRYIEDFFFDNRRVHTQHVTDLSEKLGLSRYVGVVRLDSSFFDPVDLLVDTTSTRRNARCLGIVAVDGGRPHTQYVATFLSKCYGSCPVVGL